MTDKEFWLEGKNYMIVAAMCILVLGVALSIFFSYKEQKQTDDELSKEFGGKFRGGVRVK
jgi:hypothetical protein